MSVLIKGMEMPQACFWRDKNDSLIICPLYDADGYCGADGKQRCLVPENEMQNDCPLIELPPHGRLIDADEMVASVKRQTEIMREIAKEVDKLKPIANSKELDDVDIVAIAETVEKGVLQEIANAPTILEAEVEE